jgi:hypothetical protein
MGAVDGIYNELAALRRGQGLYAPDVLERTGERLRGACGIGPDTPAGDARRRLVDRVLLGAEPLAPEQRLAVRAAFGLPPASRSRFLRERMEWLGRELDRDARTATRRVEAALWLLAEALAATATEAAAEDDSPYAPDGWYVESIRATLVLRERPVYLLEVRRLTSTQAGLDRVAVSWSLPASGERAGGRSDLLRVELLYGGALERNEALSTPSYWAGWVHLPRPLGMGEHHEYQVQVSMDERRRLRPYYAHSPLRRCDEFELRAKFDPLVPPQRVWQLDGVPSQLLDEQAPVGAERSPDRAGEVVSRFTNLRQGLTYGLVWREPPPEGT